MYVELPLIIATTMFNGATASVNDTTSDAVVPDTVFVVTLAPAGNADRSDLNTLTAVTPVGTVYDMVAVYGPGLVPA